MLLLLLLSLLELTQQYQHCTLGKQECHQFYSCHKFCECDDESDQPCMTEIQICLHDDFLENNHWRMMISYGIMVPVISFSSALGLGAELNTHLNMLLLDYPSYNSIIFFYFSTLGSSIGIMYYIIRQKQVDFEMIQILFSSLIIGTELGNTFNRLVPDKLAICISLTLASIWLAYFVKRIQSIKHKELRNLRENQEQRDRTNLCISSDFQDSSHAISPKEEQFKQRKQNIKVFIYIGIQFLYFQLMMLIRGGDKVTIFEVTYNSDTFWILTGIDFFMSLVLFGATFYCLKKQDEQLRSVAYALYCQLRSYTPSTYSAIWILGLITSFITNIIGIGYGLIIVPVFLIYKKLKLDPIQVIFTAIFCQSLMAISTTIQTSLSIFYFIQDPTIQITDISLYFTFGLVSSPFAIYLLKYLQIQKQRQYRVYLVHQP